LEIRDTADWKSALQMLQPTIAGSDWRLCLYSHHTDTERVWGVDREALIGKLDKGRNETQTRSGIAASMKDDWKNTHENHTHT
jgi:hypothetical protein